MGDLRPLAPRGGPDDSVTVLGRHQALVTTLQTFNRLFQDPRKAREPQLRAGLQTVKDLGPEVLRDLFSVFPHLPADLHRVATYSLSCLGGPDALPAMTDLVRDRRIRDEARWELIQSMVDLGFDLSSEDLSQYFHDLEAGAETSVDLDSLLEALSRDTLAASRWLGQIQQMSPDNRQGLIHDLSLCGSRSLPLLELLTETGDPGILPAILRVLGQVPARGSVELVRRIRQGSKDLKVTQLAHATEQSLLARPDLEAGVIKAITDPACGTFARPVVTYLDSAGTRHLVIPRRIRPGSRKIHVLYASCGLPEGLRDVVGQDDVTPAEHRETLPALAGPIGAAEVPLEYALGVLRDALHRTRAAGSFPCYAFALWRRRILSDQALDPRPFTLMVPAPEPTTAPPSDPEADEATRDLLDHIPFSAWILDTPTLRELAPRLPARGRAGRRPQPVDPLIYFECVAPRLGILSESLALNADLLERTGQADLARIARFTARVLVTGVPERVMALGFLRVLLERSIEVLRDSRGEP